MATKSCIKYQIDRQAVSTLLVRKGRRGEKGWTVSDLARAMRVPVGTMQCVMANRRPSSPLIRQIAEFLGVSVAEITMNER